MLALFASEDCEYITEINAKNMIMTTIA